MAVYEKEHVGCLFPFTAAGPGQGYENQEGDEEALHQDHLPTSGSLALQQQNLLTEGNLAP